MNKLIKFISKNTSSLLTFLAVFLLAVFIGYFTWAIGYIAYEVNSTNHGQATNTNGAGYDLKTAATLNYRGVLPVASS